MENTRAVIEAFWSSCETRDWAAFGDLLADDVVYEMPQTRERVRGREAYVRFNQAYPGDWHLEVERIVADGPHAATWVRFTVSGDRFGAEPQEMTGISFFELDETGLVTLITDAWPEPYEPPADRASLVERY
jgi:predicted ester cyclase